MVIVGGGSGGISVGAKFARKLGANNVAIIEPSEHHFYQPGWTLVGGGLGKQEKYRRSQKDVTPRDFRFKKVKWYQAKCNEFDPENNSISLNDGKKISYDYLIVATGVLVDFDAIKGLREALDNDENVVSIYSPNYVKKVYPALERFKGGNAIFTFPVMPIKCPGAPQKIMYMADHTFRNNNVRDKTTVMYNTTLPVIFGVKKYAAVLMEVVKARDIQVNFRTNLVEVDYKNKVATFEKLDTPGTFVKFNYDLLHAAPPNRPIKEVKNSRLVDANGFVDVVKETLQHKKYPNVYALGDCTNAPTSKTVAAIASQNYIVYKNLCRTMNNEKPVPLYDGYTSCPLITGYGSGVLAEFDFNGNPLETFPFDQGRQLRVMYHLKKDLMAPLYFYGLVNGIWNGPSFYRKMFNIFKPNMIKN